MLKITGGNLRGRVIEGADTIRSAKSIARMAMFNIIISHYSDFLKGANVLDMFGGTGILAFEALSRGAKGAIINELNGEHRGIITSNVNKLNLRENVCVTGHDANKYKWNFSDFNLIFVDPPYENKCGNIIVNKIINSKAEDKKLIVVALLCADDMLELENKHPESPARNYGNSYLKIMLI